MIYHLFPNIRFLNSRNNELLRRIQNLNFWLTVIFFLLVFGSILASDGLNAINKALELSIRSSIIFMVNIYINLLLIKHYIKSKKESSKKNKVIFLISSYSLNILAQIIISYVSYVLLKLGHPYAKNNIVVVVLFCLFINSIILSFYGNLLLSEEKIKIALENSRLKAIHSDATNQLLRQQIHPHFLFNSLNTLKSLYKVDVVLGEKYLIHLSAFLRASISKNNAIVIPLNEELKLCQDYIEMQQIRFKKALLFTVTIDQTTLNTGFVPSFSIQPLIENAIKHNELTEESPLHIQVCQINNRLKITNNLQPKKNNEVSTGSGLINLSERYRLIADDEIEINQNEQYFSVNIKILNHEYRNN